MKNKFKNAKVGQKVWSLRYGNGTITGNIHNDIHYPLIVKFYFDYGQNNHTEVFTDKGRLDTNDLTSDIYLKKPVIISKKRLNYLTDLAFTNGEFKGKMAGYREAKRIHDIELREQVEARVKAVIAEYEALKGGLNGL